MRKLWIYAGIGLLISACAQHIPVQNEITLHNAEGKEIKVPGRKALPTDAARVRYPGFKQEKIVLKAGSIRRFHVTSCWKEMFPLNYVTG